MNELKTALLSQACRTFLTLAYPSGPESIPAPKNGFLNLNCNGPVEEALLPAVCQTLRTECGGFRGYALRLGSAVYPHLKLQIVFHEASKTWLFAVDTHDNIELDADDPEADRLVAIQSANRQLKEKIERAWEQEGLVTFNGLLRRELGRL